MIPIRSAFVTVHVLLQVLQVICPPLTAVNTAVSGPQNRRLRSPSVLPTISTTPAVGTTHSPSEPSTADDFESGSGAGDDDGGEATSDTVDVPTNTEPAATDILEVDAGGSGTDKGADDDSSLGATVGYVFLAILLVSAMAAVVVAVRKRRVSATSCLPSRDRQNNTNDHAPWAFSNPAYAGSQRGTKFEGLDASLA